MGSVWPIRCPACERVTFKPVAIVNRAERTGGPLYCDRTCAGLARRDQSPPSPDEKRAAKAKYDRERREKLGEALLEKKRAAYRAALRENPEKVRAAQRLNREGHKDAHLQYCRRAEYKKWKAEYDKKHRSRKQFGDFGEAAIILNDLMSEINSRITRTEIYRQNGTLNKWQARRREYEQQTDRR